MRWILLVSLFLTLFSPSWAELVSVGRGRLAWLPPHSASAPVVLYLGAPDPRLGEVFHELGWGSAVFRPGSVEDATAAVAWVKSHSDGHALVLIGEGDSAQIAAHLACESRWLDARGLKLSDVKGCILLSSSLEPAAFAEVKGGTPWFVIAGHDESPALASFQKAGVSVEVKVLPEGRTAATGAALTTTDDPVQKAVRHFVAECAPQELRGLQGVTFVKSPNWDVRPLDGKIDAVIVHSTVINTLEGTERAFLDDKVRRVSAHYVVDRDGTIVQMVDERFTAWHAGVSELEGRTGVNDFSVGIEIVNLNDGKDPYTDAQYDAVARIIRDLRSRWTIPDHRVMIGGL